MLEVLFGGKNVKKVLIFLFVNGKCYGTQLHKSLRSALTPLQKALQRLEEGGVIVSFYEGKTRLYQFNPAYPLLTELEALLKKAYTLLPPQEKKEYCFIQSRSMSYASMSHINMSHERQDAKTLSTIWEKLSQVRSVIVHAKTKSKEEGGWNGKGRGDVLITKGEEKKAELIFTEKGSWKNDVGKEIDFSNIFRWTYDRERQLISLEHLRYGVDHPVFLFHLAPTGNLALTSVDAHLCEGDLYFGHLAYDAHGLRLHFRVIGPKKNEEIDYYYTAS